MNPRPQDEQQAAGERRMAPGTWQTLHVATAAFELNCFFVSKRSCLVRLQNFAGGGDDEREPVDIGTPEERRHALAELLHASPDSQLPLLHLPLQLKHLPKAGRPSNASELSPAAKAGETPGAQ